MLPLKAIAGLLLGFFLPGYLLARLLRSPHRLVPAFLASHAVLFLDVFALGVLGVPLGYGTVVTGLALVTIAIGGALLLRGGASAATPSALRPGAVVSSACVAAVLLLACRAVLSPLSGADTYFRWEHLALQMRRAASFSFYPPLTPPDFASYFYVDAIPPLVSFSYYWLYECFGSEDRRLAALLLVTQYGAALTVAYQLTATLATDRAACVAVLALLSSPLFFWAFVQGQETGLITLSLGAALLLMLRGDSGSRGALLAAACAAVAALSREYGPALVACTGLVAAARGRAPRDVLLFLALAGAIAAPWYARTWVLSGNPFYSNPVLGLFPVNEVHVGFLRTYAAALVSELRAAPAAAARTVLLLLVGSAPLQCTWGFLAAGLLIRRLWPLAATAGVVFALWAYALPSTSGGLGASLRVLAPALLLLSCLVGIHADGLPSLSRRLPWLVGPVVLYGLFASAWVPFKPGALSLREALLFNLPRQDEERAAFLAPLLKEAGGRVVSDNPYAHPGLSRRGVEVAPLWSPEFAFVFDASISGADARQRLRARGVSFVLYGPDSLNEPFLRRTRLFAEDRAHWTPFAEASGWSVLALP